LIIVNKGDGRGMVCLFHGCFAWMNLIIGRFYEEWRLTSRRLFENNLREY